MPACATLNCYVCSTDMPGCNDPFNAKAYTVTTDSSSSNTYCVVIAIFLFAMNKNYLYLESTCN